MAAEPVERVDFEHSLHFLPPVAHGEMVLWFAYLDEPDRWRRASPSAEQLALAAAEMLRKLLHFERTGQAPGNRTPNATAGTVRPLPNLAPRWTARVIADCSEETVEWRIELQDESAWSWTDVDLSGAMVRLAKRLEAAHELPQPLPLNRASPPAPPRLLPITPDQASWEEITQTMLGTIEAEIEKERRVITDVEVRITVLEGERRALHAALSAYRKHAGRPVKRLPRPEDGHA